MRFLSIIQGLKSLFMNGVCLACGAEITDCSSAICGKCYGKIAMHNSSISALCDVCQEIGDISLIAEVDILKICSICKKLFIDIINLLDINRISSQSEVLDRIKIVNDIQNATNIDKKSNNDEILTSSNDIDEILMNYYVHQYQPYDHSFKDGRIAIIKLLILKNIIISKLNNKRANQIMNIFSKLSIDCLNIIRGAGATRSSISSTMNSRIMKKSNDNDMIRDARMKPNDLRKKHNLHPNTDKKSAFIISKAYNSIARTVLHKFKYYSAIRCRWLFARLIRNELEKVMHNMSKFTYIIPVPLHDNRIAKRGFNQSLEIAKSLSKMIKIPYISNAILRIRDTTPQSQFKDPNDRSKNVKDAFALHPRFEKQINESGAGDITLILIDDILTSGSTAIACKNKLMEIAKVRLLFVCTVFGAMKNDNNGNLIKMDRYEI